MKSKGLRYQERSGSEGSFQPGSRGRVLANLKGITSKRAMDLAEYEALVRVQDRYYDIVKTETRFTATLLCQMHYDWLGEIYVWAGKYRTVELQKGGFAWPPAFLVPANMAAFERDMLKRYTLCRPGSLYRIADALSRVHAELLLVHPFREGNGRLARWLADLMTLQAGYSLPGYELVGRGSSIQQRKYIAAVSQGYVQNYAPLVAFFTEAIRRAER